MNILVVGAHHDDCEIGCGGTIAKMTSAGHTVFGITLSNSATSFAEKGIYRTSAEAVSESKKAAEVIGLNLVELDHPLADNGMLDYDTDLMRKIEEFNFKNKIEMVFGHWLFDLNTDHQNAAKMTIVASRHVPSVLQFRSNWYEAGRPFAGTYFFDVSDHIEKKIQSLEHYEVEIRNRGREWIDSFIKHNAISGLQINKKYAEVFEPIKVTHL